MKKRSKIIIGIAVLLLGVVFFSVKGKNRVEYETVSIEKKTITQEVIVTGKVKPAQIVDLAFENSGKVSAVNVKVGDIVKEQDVLAFLNNSDLQAQLQRNGAMIQSANAELRQYEAALLSEKAKFDELKSGSRSEEVQIARTNGEKAQTALSDAEKNVERVKEKAVIDLNNAYDDVPDVLQAAYTNAMVAFREEINSLFSKGTDFDRLSFLTKDSLLKIDIERQKMIIEDDLAIFSSEVNSIPLDQSGRNFAITKARSHLLKLREFLGNLSLAVDDSVGLSDLTENLYRGYVNTSKGTVNTAITSLSSLEQSLSSQKTNNDNALQSAYTNVNTAKQSLVLAQNELTLKLAGPRKEELSAAEARIAQAEANIGAARARVAQAAADYQGGEANLQKTVIKAPFAGIVTKVDTKVAEIVSLNTPVLSVISQAEFEIEANISEVDISKLALGKVARVTLDAYGTDVIFEAKVSQIDPAETIVDGVATYTVTLQFIKKDDRIKSGMTANVTILTEKKDTVLGIPLRAVTSKNGKKYVRILKEKNMVEEREVQVGLRGTGGNVEIISGLVSGEILILSEKQK